MEHPLIIFIRGGGDLASGVALRLHRAGLRLLITELAQPLVVRRLVSFGNAVYAGQMRVEGVLGQQVHTTDQVQEVLAQGNIPVLVDSHLESRHVLQPDVIVDARMLKRAPELGREAARLTIGLGPGFVAGQNCHAVVETNRGHQLGRVIWEGAAEADTGVPEHVREWGVQRVLRAPATGTLQTRAEIGDQVRAGQEVAAVNGQPVVSAFDGVVRGLLYSGLRVTSGVKIGDIDPRNDPHLAHLVSDKSLAVGGGVLEAILSQPELRPRLWGSS